MNCWKKATMPATGRNIRVRQIRQRLAQMGDSQSKTEAVQTNSNRAGVHSFGRNRQSGVKREENEKSPCTGNVCHSVTIQGLQTIYRTPHSNAAGSSLPDIKNHVRSPEYKRRTGFEVSHHRNNNSQQNPASKTSDPGITKRPHVQEEKNETVVTKQMKNRVMVHTSGPFTSPVDRVDKLAWSHQLLQDQISLNGKADEFLSRGRHHENSQVISSHGESTIKARQTPQVLGQTPRIFEILSSNTEVVNWRQMDVTNAFGQVLRSMNHTSGPKSTTMTQFMNIVSSREHEFRIGYQNDCHSFLLTLLSELNKETPGKDIANLFETEMVDQFTFDSCRHTDETDTQILRSITIPSESRQIHVPEALSYCSLNIENIKEGLQSFFQEEEFDEQEIPCRICLKGNKRQTLICIVKLTVLICVSCQNVRLLGYGKTRKSMMFRNLPRVLVLQLGCFQEMSYGGRLRIAKSSRRISFDEVLRVPHKNGNILTYQLYGVVNHHGSTYGGHYTSYVKHLPRQSDWYYCNDSHVSKSALPDALSSSDAYLLFYKL
ncbi:ubiquitin carboxyl-terminal hydrolase 2-like isoform X3 [Ostrea edulis]|uniref:ubiquitin carboxyl-terminal hydrolase 2-like isoform X3 n=1 Tax=Ostrea edulis TaxID=37623 RepID=UPI0024AF5BE3|nr:ubiquitin carboxyl-terminal hydrolase 2-like isoform X3 [Ostrea edulis]